MAEVLAYNFTAQIYNTSQQLQVVEFCNSITVKNLGDVLVRVGNVPVLPSPGAGLSGESFTTPGNFGEIFTGNNGALLIAFDASGGGTNPLVLIIQKYYIPKYKLVPKEL